MTITKNSFRFIATVVGAIVALSLVLGAFVVHANPSQFTNTTQTATATSTVSYQTPGTATSTLVADTYQVATGNNYTNSQTELLIQFTASSTLSQLNINLEYSNGYPGVDCIATPNICDWYQDSISNMISVATTSSNVTLSQVSQYQWKFASSTVGQGVVSGTNNRDTRAIAVTVPVRYVRAIATCALGGANCGAWMQFVPQKEVR